MKITPPTALAALLLIALSLPAVKTAAQSAVLSNPSACRLGLPVADNSCSDEGLFRNPSRFRIQVSNAPGSVLGNDVFLSEVRLLIRHEWSGDLDIFLISPSGKSIMLSSDNGGGDDNYGNPAIPECRGYMSFSAGSCLPVADADAPFANGPYQPEESLFGFNDGRTNPNNIWILEICDDADEDAGILDYVELVFQPISCLPVQNLEVQQVDTTTVTLQWEPNTCGLTVIEFGPPGFRPGTNLLPGQGTVLRTDCSPYSLEGMDPDTEYEIYVRRFCDTTSLFSPNSCPVRVRTGCKPPPATIVSTFDEETACQAACGLPCPLTGFWRNDSRDDVDWIAFSGPTPTQGTGPAADVNGGSGKYLYFEASENSLCRPDARAILLSNCMRFSRSGSDTCHLSFNYHLFGSDIGSLRLELTTNGGFSWTPIWERRGDQGNAWHKVYLGLAFLPEGALVQFRFVGQKGAGAKGDMAIDEIVFYGSEDLGPPSNLFYADADGDGFGDPARFVASCVPAPPNGFVANSGDCDDTNPDINPTRPEVPCDGIDNNCNGDADDALLPSPLAVHDTICSGETPTICAQPLSGKFILWYASATGNDFLGQLGECYAPVLPQNNSSSPVVYRFYAEETDFICRSAQRTEVIVVVNPRPDVFAPQQPSLCLGQSFDLSGLNLGDANFTGASFSFHTASPAGPENRLPSSVITPSGPTAYVVLGTSPEGCTDEANLSVNVKPGPSLNFEPADTFSLCRESIQRISAEASGGAGNFRYRWSTGATTPGIDVRAAALAGQTDTYFVTVTDGEGCFSVDSVRVRTIVSIEAVRRSVSDVTVCSGRDGSIELTPLSGLPPFRFQWRGTNGSQGDTSGISQTLRLTDLGQGSYRVTITDNSSQACPFTLRSILVNGPDAVIEEPDVQAVRCAGASNGGICLNVRGSDLRFRWNTGDSTQCIENIPAGNYSVTVSEGSCETVLSDIQVAEPAPLSLRVDQSPPSCHNSSDGSLSASAFGGSAPYAFQWSASASGPLYANLPAGDYPLTLTDRNGCQLVDTIRMLAPEPLTINTEVERSPRCAGSSDGFLQVSGRGGAGAYRYLWNTGGTAPQLARLGPGAYSVTLTDAKGCEASRQLALREPAPLQVAFSVRDQPLCEGDATGRLGLATSGGTRPYRYRWSGGENDSLLTNLPVGSYAVVVEDANGCRADTLRTNLRPRSVLGLNAQVTAPECQGAVNGRINLQPSGNGPFQFNWSSGATTPQISDIGTGDYAVTITDGQGCRYDTLFSITAPQAFRVEFSSRSPSCAGGRDGVVSPVVLAGNVPPLTYTWSNGSNSSALFGVEKGNYVLTLTNSRGCRFISDTIRVQEPEPLVAEISGSGQINCKGDSTGFIELDVRGGVKPYTYNWQGLNVSNTSSAVFNLPAGEYRVQVLDANNCPANAGLNLPEPPDLLVQVNVQISDPCRGAGTNRVTAAVSGGIGPYAYKWSTGDSNPELSNLQEGDYALTVEDANKCVEIVPSIKVRETLNPLRLDSFVVKDISCFGAEDGEIRVKISGGKPAYRFHFSNNNITVTSGTSLTLTGLPRNNGYSVTITDLNTGCVVTSGRVPLREPALLSSKIDSLRQVACADGKDGAIFASTVGGVAPYRYSWFEPGGRPIGIGASLTEIGAGQYLGIVSDANGCRDTLPLVELTNRNPPLRRLDSLTIVQNVRCRGARTGRIDITMAGGAPPYQYLWSNGSRLEDLGNVGAGTYTLTVTDASGCRQVFPGISISEPTEVITATGSGINVSCFGSADGQLQARILGGTPPYMLSWINGMDTLARDTLRLNQLAAGVYTLQVQDQIGCIRQFPFEVGQPPLLTVHIALELPSPPTNAGRALAQASGGTPNYTYLWSTGATTTQIDTLRESRYSVTVTDENGCVATDSVLLTSSRQAELVRTVRLFPNPATERLILEIRLQQAAELDLAVFDAGGRPVEVRRLGPVHEQQLLLEWPHLPPGVYQVVLRHAGAVVFAGKVLLQR